MTTIVFIQVQGSDSLVEATLPAEPTYEQLFEILAKRGVELGDGSFVFLDEEDEPLTRKPKKGELLPPIKRGCRIHVTKCRKIKVTVNYLEKTADQTFAPGARVKKVKAWAVKTFGLDANDAAEHVLQLCGSTDRPATDTTLRQLTAAPVCSVCFDLVPEKRVEG